MKIIIIADVYPPEISSAAHLMQELAEGLKKRGHEISIVTCYPRHYLDTASQNKKFNEITVENGITVIRIKVLPHHKVNFIIRGISQFLLPFLFFTKIKKYISNVDAVIIYSPPLPLALIGKMIKMRYGAKFLLNIQDIFPQNAIDLEILNPKIIWHKIAIKIFEFIEKKVYLSADKITFHSEGGRKFIVTKKGVPEDKIINLPNWIDIAPYQNLTKNISFKKEWGLENKFIFLFAGIMGPAQGLGFLVEVAKGVSDLRDVVFLLVGDGMEKEKIEKLIRDYGLCNVIIKPFISKEEYPYLVQDCDAGIVCLSIHNKTPFIPGKFMGYLAAEKPVLAFLNKESDGFQLVKEAQCGFAVVSENVETATALVYQMVNNRATLKQMGQNGFQYAKDNFEISIIIDRVEKLLTNIKSDQSNQ